MDEAYGVNKESAKRVKTSASLMLALTELLLRLLPHLSHPAGTMLVLRPVSPQLATRIARVSLLLALSTVVAERALGQVATTTQSLSFQTLDQSMWGSGPAQTLSFNRFLGTSWNTTASVGQIFGGVNEVCIPVPFFDDICGDVDTRTGAKFSAQTNGTIGVALNAKLSGGSVDVTYGGQASITAASQYNPGEVFTIGSSFVLDPFASVMQSEFASLEAWADLRFDVFAKAEVKGCVIGLGCAGTSGTIIDVNATKTIASLNRNQDGALKVLGVEVPLEASIGPIDVTATLPNLQTSGGAVGGDLKSSGGMDVLSLGMDVPRVVADAILPGLGYALSGDIGGMIGYNVFASSIGPTLGLAQNFLFDATPMVTLSFSQPVQQVVGGVAMAAKSSLTFALGQEINILGSSYEIEIVPFYFLQNTLRVQTDITARMDASLTLLELYADLPLGLPDMQLGPVYSDNFSTAQTAFNVDTRTFAMEFGGYAGESINLTATPEPATLLLMGTGIAGIGAWRRRQQRRKKIIAA
jgi:hypothetical protein